jgi:hypothetical protein
MVETSVLVSESVVVLIVRCDDDESPPRSVMPNGDEWIGDEELQELALLLAERAVEAEETKPVEGDEAKANRAVAATWRNRYCGFTAAARRGMTDNNNSINNKMNCKL